MPSSDLAAFSSVCPSWRAAAGAALFPPYSRPPILLSRQRKKQLWCAHDIASPAAHPSLHKLPLLGSHSRYHIAGVSRGRLILATGSKENIHVTVLDPISGVSVCSPPLPRPENARSGMARNEVSGVLLNFYTVVVFLPSSTVLQWHIGAEEWALVHSLKYTPYMQNSYNQLTALPDGRLFLVSDRSIFALRLEPKATLKELALLPGLPERDHINLDGCCRLFSCDIVIMYLRLVLTPSWTEKSKTPNFRVEVKVFRLVESVSATLEWVQLHSLGDYAIFVSLRVGVPPVMCRNPQRWGGRSDCIYFAENGYFEFLTPDSHSNDRIWHVVDLVDGTTTFSCNLTSRGRSEADTYVGPILFPS